MSASGCSCAHESDDNPSNQALECLPPSGVRTSSSARSGGLRGWRTIPGSSSAVRLSTRKFTCQDDQIFRHATEAVRDGEPICRNAPRQVVRTSLADSSHGPSCSAESEAMRKGSFCMRGPRVIAFVAIGRVGEPADEHAEQNEPSACHRGAQKQRGRADAGCCDPDEGAHRGNRTRRAAATRR